MTHPDRLSNLIAPGSLLGDSSTPNATRAASGASPRRGRDAAPSARREDGGEPPPPPGDAGGDWGTDPEFAACLAVVVAGLVERLGLIDEIDDDAALCRMERRADRLLASAMPAMQESHHLAALRMTALACGGAWLVMRALHRRVLEVREGGDQ